MTANEALNKHYKSLSSKERAKLTLSLMTQLDVTYFVIENWRYARTAIKPVYRREISRIIGEDIFSEVIDL